MPAHKAIYQRLQTEGFTLMFKDVIYIAGKPKGNVDAELVLHAMIEYRAVIVTSDGDFACLVRHLKEKEKLERVLSPSREGCSALLKQAAQEKMDFLEEAKRKIERRN